MLPNCLLKDCVFAYFVKYNLIISNDSCTLVNGFHES